MHTTTKSSHTTATWWQALKALAILCVVFLDIPSIWWGTLSAFGVSFANVHTTSTFRTCPTPPLSTSCPTHPLSTSCHTHSPTSCHTHSLSTSCSLAHIRCSPGVTSPIPVEKPWFISYQGVSQARWDMQSAAACRHAVGVNNPVYRYAPSSTAHTCTHMHTHTRAHTSSLRLVHMDVGQDPNSLPRHRFGLGVDLGWWIASRHTSLSVTTSCQFGIPRMSWLMRSTHHTHTQSHELLFIVCNTYGVTEANSWDTDGNGGGLTWERVQMYTRQGGEGTHLSDYKELIEE